MATPDDWVRSSPAPPPNSEEFRRLHSLHSRSASSSRSLRSRLLAWTEVRHAPAALQLPGASKSWDFRRRHIEALGSSEAFGRIAAHSLLTSSSGVPSPGLPGSVRRSLHTHLPELQVCLVGRRWVSGARPLCSRVTSTWIPDLFYYPAPTCFPCLLRAFFVFLSPNFLITHLDSVAASTDLTDFACCWRVIRRVCQLGVRSRPLPAGAADPDWPWALQD